MNKLKGSVCYLCGPIDYADDLGTGWRKQIIPELRKMGMFILDPTNKPVMYQNLYEDAENHEHRRKLKEAGKFDELHESGKLIRTFDLRCCDKADCIIVHWDISIPMTGTAEELFISNKSKKPVLVFCKQGRYKVPDWLYWTLPPKYIFENAQDIVSYLHKVDRGEEIDNARWHFFDWEKIIRGD
jgi:hypothetical protein